MKRSSARATGMLAVAILIAVFDVAPVAFAAADVYVCKVVGHPGAYHLQGGDNPINVNVNALGSDINPVIGAPFNDSHPSFVIASNDYALCEANLPPTHVNPPTFTAGCLVAGTVDAPETDAYTWAVSGGEDATVYTAVAESGYTLALPKAWTYDLSPMPYQSTNSEGKCYVKPAVTVAPTVPGDPTIQPKITLKAAVVNDAGGTAEVSDFTLTGSSIDVTHEAAVQNSAAMVASAATTSFSGATGAAEITNAVVPVGTYSLSESALPPGYSASAWACTGGQLNGSAVTVGLGSTVECLITNTYSSTVVDSPGVPTAGPAAPPRAVLGVNKAAPVAKAPTVKAPTVKAPIAATPAATTLAFTGAEPVPLSLLALLALVLGIALTVAGRRQGGQRARG